MVVEEDPVANHATGLLQRFKAMAVHALLLERADGTLHQTVLLGAVWRDEFLLQPVAFHQRRVAATGEHQAVFRTQQKRRRHAAQATKAGNQSLFQRGLGRARAGAARQVTAQNLAAVAVDHQGQRCPAILATPDTAQVRGPALIGP